MNFEENFSVSIAYTDDLWLFGGNAKNISIWRHHVNSLFLGSMFPICISLQSKFQEMLYFIPLLCLVCIRQLRSS